MNERFEPGTVYQSTLTRLRFLCIGEGSSSDPERRTLYYVFLSDEGGGPPYNWEINTWDYIPGTNGVGMYTEEE